MLNISDLRLEVLKKQGFNPKMVVDVGAHKGKWTEMVHAIWPNSEYLMVEPNTKHEGNLANISFAQYELALLGEAKKEKVGYYSSQAEHTTGNSIYKEQSEYSKYFKKIYLPMTTLSEVLKKRDIKKVDLLKIDAQGSEMNIIKGYKKYLKNTEFIILECQVLEYSKGAPQVDEIIETMKKNYNFRVFDVLELLHLPSGELVSMDILFANEKSKFIRRGIVV